MKNNKQDPQDNLQHQQPSFMAVMARIQNLWSKNETEELKEEINKSQFTQEEKEKLHQSLQKSQDEGFNNQQTTSYLEVNKDDQSNEEDALNDDSINFEPENLPETRKEFDGSNSEDSSLPIKEVFHFTPEGQGQQKIYQKHDSEGDTQEPYEIEEKKDGMHSDKDPDNSMDSHLNKHKKKIQGANELTPPKSQLTQEKKEKLHQSLQKSQDEGFNNQQTTDDEETDSGERIEVSIRKEEIENTPGSQQTSGQISKSVETPEQNEAEIEDADKDKDIENLKDQNEVLKEEAKITEAEESGIDSSQNKQKLKEGDSQLIENIEYPILEDGLQLIENSENLGNGQAVNSEKDVLLAENPQPTYWQSGKAKCSSALTTIAGAAYTYFYNPIKNMTVASCNYCIDKVVAGYNYSVEKPGVVQVYSHRGSEQHEESKCQKQENEDSRAIPALNQSVESQNPLEEEIVHLKAQLASQKAKLASQKEFGKSATYFIETLPIQERTVSNIVHYAKLSINYTQDKFIDWYYGEQEKSSMPAEASFSRVSAKDYISQENLTWLHIGVSMMLAQSAETKMQSAATLFHSFVYASKKHVIDTDDFTTQAAIDVVSSGVSGFVYLGPWGSAISAGITSTKYGLEYFGYKQAAIIFDQTQGLSTLYHVGFFNNKNILHSVRELFKDGAYTKLLIGATEVQKLYYDIIDSYKHGSITEAEFAEYWSVRHDIDVREKEFQEALKINPDDIAVLKLQNSNLASENYKLTSDNEALTNDIEELKVMVSEMHADPITKL
jgi:hypothetical protein